MGRSCSPVAKHIATLYKAMNLISSTEINFTPGNNLTDTDLKLVLSFIEATECSPHCIEFSSSKEHMHNRHQNNQQSNVLQEKKKHKACHIIISMETVTGSDRSIKSKQEPNPSKSKVRSVGSNWDYC